MRMEIQPVSPRSPAVGAAVAPRFVRGVLNLEKAILASFLAGLFFLVLLGALSWYAADRALAASRALADAHARIGALRELEAQLYLAFANQRAWLLGGGERMRTRREAALEAAERVLARLGPEEGARSDLAPLRAVIGERREHFAELDRLAEAHGLHRAAAAFRPIEPEVAIAPTLARAREAEERLLAAAQSAERRTLHALHATFALVAVLLAAGYALLFRRIRVELERREQSEARARGLAERLERALAAGGIALWELDARSGTVFLHHRLDDPDGARRLPVSVSPSELLELVFPEDRERLRAAVERIAAGAGEEWSAEHRLRGTANEWRWVLSRAQVTDRDPASGRPLRVSGTSVDITERKLAEEKLAALAEELERRVKERTAELQDLAETLRDNEAELCAIIEATPEAILIADAGGRILLANPAAERLFGRQAAELQGAPLDLLVPERYRTAHREHLRRFLVSGESRRRMGDTMHVSGLRADGTEFPLDAAIARFAHRGETRLLFLGRDASAEVGAMRELEALARTLEERVAQRTAELEAANRELESFSYSVSHDLRAPIRAVNGFAHLLEETDGARLSEEGRRLLGTIRKASLRMGALVDDLLRLARVGRGALAPEEVDVGALAREVAAELLPRYPAARIEIGDLPPARADRALLRQLLANLVQNALKYSARRPEPHVTIGALPDAPHSVYFVRDNGEGFDPRYAAKLFEPFQRLHGAEFEGSGIGLAIVRRIAERHGGRVWAESAPGEGATFYFTLANGPAR